MRFWRVLVCMILCFVARAAWAEWPERVFAPYAYIGSEGRFKIADCEGASGQRFFTLAFVIADGDKKPAWDGQVGMDKNLYVEQIADIRKRGGDVMVSFGGQGGSELATVDDKIDSLVEKYRAVAERYHFTWMDFDIEGAAVANQAANQRRNAALAKMQATDAGLVVSYTLPASPDGLSADAMKLLADAKQQGVRVRCVNIMTMDFGAYYSKGKKLSDVCIASAEKVHEQLGKVDAKLGVGLTPMIGQNDMAGEVFTLADARALRAWADGHAWISGLSFWSVNRDTGDRKKTNLNDSSKVDQQPWEFTGVFKTFGQKGSADAQPATQKAIWWQNVLDRQALLQAHGIEDAKTAPPWVAPAGVDSDGTITVGAQKRTYLLHVPASYDGKTSLPLVVALHGGGMDGASMAYYSGISDVADRESFIVAYPDGAIRPVKNSWDAHMNSSPDDVVFIRELIAKLESSMAIDRRHVMVAGGSAGALLTYRFGLESGDRVTAIGSMSGTFVWNMRNGEPPAMAAPVAPVSVIAIHGRQDKAVPYAGLESERVREWPTTRTVEFWAKTDGCGAVPVEEREPGVLKQTWSGGRNGTEVCLISLDDFGHNLPSRLSDPGPIKCSQVLWDFLVRDRGCRLLPLNRMFAAESVSVTAERSARLPAEAELRCTVDGSAPTATALLGDKPLKITADTTVRVQAFVSGKAVGAETMTRYVRLPLRPAESVSHSAAGLRYAYYEGAWPSLPEVAALKPTTSGVCAAADLALLAHRKEDFVVTFMGFLRVPQDGVYTVSTISDDGSGVWIGQTRAIDSDGLHDPLECARTVGLSAGLHPITIRYLQRGGEAVLSVSMEGPGMAKRVLGAADFCHEE